MVRRELDVSQEYITSVFKVEEFPQIVVVFNDIPYTVTRSGMKPEREDLTILVGLENSCVEIRC